MNTIRVSRLPPLLLAVFLQFAPLATKLTQVNWLGAPAPFSLVLRCGMAVAALLGTVDAVSGASAAIAGMAQISPPGQVTFSATGHVGQLFGYRIIVTNPGMNPQQAFWNAVPLPPGLMIDTNTGANGFIAGTPTTGGVYPITLTAGNRNTGFVTTNATITILGNGSPPMITGQPMSLAVTNGDTARFTVVATGAPPPTYQWQFGRTNLPGATLASLVISNAQPANAGDYTVIVSNASGTLPSTPAHLTVQVPPPVPLLLASPQWLNGSPAFDITGPLSTNYVILRSTDLVHWTPLQTNFTALGIIHFTDTNLPPINGFYRAALSP